MTVYCDRFLFTVKYYRLSRHRKIIEKIIYTTIDFGGTMEKRCFKTKLNLHFTVDLPVRYRYRFIIKA